MGFAFVLVCAAVSVTVIVVVINDVIAVSSVTGGTVGIGGRSRN